MLHKTKGIVLRVVKYGEASLIVSIYTELFGMQTYIVNGVRRAGKKGHGRANLFQPSSILDLVVYQNDLSNLQRLREFKWNYLYQTLQFDIRKNTVTLFMVELLQKTLKQPEHNEQLYYFMEDAFIHLDRSSDQAVANFPLFFALHLSFFSGFRITDNYSSGKCILDLQEGNFVADYPSHPRFLEGQLSYITSQLLKIRVPSELEQLSLNAEIRRNLLQAYQDFYALHIQDFGSMRSIKVLQEILS